MLRIFIFLILTLTSIFGKDIYTYIPKNAYPLMPKIYSEIEAIIPDKKVPSYFMGLIEQESCITLTRKRCFGPKSRLKHTRKDGSTEEGAGMLQLTRVWRKNGRIRFDTLRGLVKKYPKELGELNWKSVYKRTDLQIRAGILLWRDNYNRIKMNFGGGMNEVELIAMADAAYNGGYGGLRRDIYKCISTKGCNPKKWFGHVEYTCTKSKRKLYGDRDACDINRDHVRRILFKRWLKYHVFSEIHSLK